MGRKQKELGTLSDLVANAADVWWKFVGTVTLTDNLIEPLLPERVGNYQLAETRMGDIGNFLGVGATVATIGGLVYLGYLACKK